MLENRPLYLDYHATTPVDRRVLDAMLPYFTEGFGNASSIDHLLGTTAQAAVEKARGQVASAIGAETSEIIFTSGATESNNLALRGVAEAYVAKGRHIITCATEHPAVLDPCRQLERQGWQLTILPVDATGLVDPTDVRRAITSSTVLVSVMAANNEIGTIAPLKEIGRIAKECQILFHTDATQAIGKIAIDVRACGIDLLSLSAHKMYGPKGAGALFVGKRRPRVKLEPQTRGGGHERGLRSGTLNVPGIVGMGFATEIAAKEMSMEVPRLRALRDRLCSVLEQNVGGITVNGHAAHRLPNNLNISIEGVDAKALLVALRNHLCISAGSACATNKVEPSHVLRALGIPDERIYQTVRFSLGRPTTEHEIDFAGEQVHIAVKSLRRIAAGR